MPVASPTHDPNDFFALEAAFPGYNWYDVHGTSATNVFAVGETGGVGAIAKRGAAGWALQTIPSVPPLDQIWVGDTSIAIAISTDAGALQSPSTVLKWNGATWSTLSVPGISGQHRVWGTSPTSIMFTGTVVGVPGGILASQPYDGTTFGAVSQCPTPISFFDLPTAIFNPTGTTYYGMYGVTNARLYKIVNGVCVDTPTASAPGDRVGDLWAAAATIDNYWGLGTTGLYDYPSENLMVATPSPMSTTTASDVDGGIWGLSASNVWAVGAVGTITHYDGTSWTVEPNLPSDEFLEGVYFSDTTNGWIVSRSGNIYKLNVNPAVAHPTLTGIDFDPLDHTIQVSQAQCLGDDIDFTIIADSGTVNDMDVWIINGETDVVVEQIDDSQMFAITNKYWHFNRTYPAGSYQAISIVDVMSVLTPDTFAVAPFNVPRGTCYTAEDSQLIQSRFDSLERDVAYVNSTTLRTESNVTQVNGSVNSAHTHIDSHFVYANANVNSTSATMQALLNSVHTHIDGHFVYTNQLFNDTFTGVTFNITVTGGIANETVRLLANEFGLELGETSTLNILIILLMVVIGVWMYRKKEHDLVVRTCGILIVLTAGLIALVTATAWTGGAVFAALVCFLAAGLMVVGFLENRRERNGKRRKGELDL